MSTTVGMYFFVGSRSNGNVGANVAVGEQRCGGKGLSDAGYSGWTFRMVLVLFASVFGHDLLCVVGDAGDVLVILIFEVIGLVLRSRCCVLWGGGGGGG